MFCEEDTQCNNWVSLLLTFKITTMKKPFKKQYGILAFLNSGLVYVRLRYTYRDVAIRVIEYFHNNNISIDVTEVKKNNIIVSTEFVFTCHLNNFRYIKSFSREGKIKRLQNEVSQLRLSI